MSFTVLSWNVLFEIRDAGVWRADLRHPALFDRALQADIACFQEITPWSLEALGRRGGALHPTDPAGVSPYGVATWSRAAPTEVRSFRLATSKAALLTRHAIGGGALWVLNLHLSSDLHADAPERRALEIDSALPALPEDEAVVLLGDLNCGAGARPPGIAAAGFRDVWEHLRPDEAGFTWEPAANAIAAGIKANAPPRRLDGIWWRPGRTGLVPRAIERIREEGPAALPLSDHDGVIASFEFSS